MAELLPYLVFAAVLGLFFLRWYLFHEEPATEGAPRPFLTRRQYFDLVGLPALPAALFVVLLHTKYDYLKMLWEKVLGIKMLITASLFLIVGEGTILLLYILQNRVEPGSKWSWLLALGVFLVVVFFIVPVIMIILTGPAAIQIIEGFR